jgi:signal transduction histidine kinase
MIEDFEASYGQALQDWLQGSREDALHRSYELGRRALAEGRGVIDIIRLHHSESARLVASSLTDDAEGFVKRGAEVLAECLSAFEMRLRGYEEANAGLHSAHSELSKAHAELAEAHDRLKAEIAEREKAEEALLHAQKLQAVGLLAGGVAHNFNNLLMVIIGNLNIALRLASDPKLQERLVAARDGAERGAKVVQQLLTFSRKQVLTPRVLDIAEWLPEMRSLLANSLRSDIALETSAERGTWPVFVDPGQLELATLNLAVNSRDAMPRGGALRIAVANCPADGLPSHLQGRFVRFEVTDTGEGIPPEALAHIFEPFFTTKPAGAGTGLGLSQVHGFAQQSGGEVHIESTPGEGTKVGLLLPAADHIQPVSGPSAEVAPARGAGRILVVEDDRQIGEIVLDMLETEGYAVVMAEDPQRALDLLNRGPFDLVVSDIVMPGMGGVQFAKEVQRLYPGLPILLASGYGDAVAEGARSEMPVVRKPYRIEDLRPYLQKLMSRTLGDSQA